MTPGAARNWKKPEAHTPVGVITTFWKPWLTHRADSEHIFVTRLLTFCHANGIMFLGGDYCAEEDGKAEDGQSKSGQV